MVGALIIPKSDSRYKLLPKLSKHSVLENVPAKPVSTTYAEITENKNHKELLGQKLSTKETALHKI